MATASCEKGFPYRVSPIQTPVSAVWSDCPAVRALDPSTDTRLSKNVNLTAVIFSFEPFGADPAVCVTPFVLESEQTQCIVRIAKVKNVTVKVVGAAAKGTMNISQSV